MKAFTLIIFAVVLAGCCSTKDTTRTTFTMRDATAQPSTVTDSSGNIQDASLIEWLNDEVSARRPAPPPRPPRLPAERDTTTVVKYLPTKPFKHTWQAFKVTQRGDSVWVTFRFEDNTGKFTWQVVPAKVHISIAESNTVTTKEKLPTWYERLWSDFKDITLIGAIFVLAVGLLLQRFKII